MVRINFAGTEFSNWLKDLKDSGIEICKDYTLVVINNKDVEFTARPGNEDLEVFARLRWEAANER